MKISEVKTAKPAGQVTEVESFPFPNDTDLNTGILDSAIEAFMRDVVVNYNFDIPYVAGYSTNGDTVYIDRDLPLGYTQTDGKEVTVERYLVLHEVVEKTLLMRFDNLVYETAHQLALRLEQSAVESDGVDWKQYNNFFLQEIKTCGDESIQKVPEDLDLTPYFDEDDITVLQKLRQAMSNGT